MPVTKRTPTFDIRLSQPDLDRFDSMCRVQGKNRAEMARQLILWCLDNEDKLQTDAKQTKLEKRLQKMENRLAGLLARSAIDIGTIYHVLWYRSDPEKRKELWDVSKTATVDRLRKKLKDQDGDIRDLIRDSLSSEA